MRKFCALLSLLLLMACSKSTPQLENIDTVSWKNDRNACMGKRGKMLDALKAQQDKLLALKETQIVALLGRPDNNELYERNQKFYYYYITPAPACENSDTVSLQLEIRFNALGYSKEIYIK
jgi:outer membrane protein assembly factor BamE (lipoprotein component of BamABCDE complex)